MSVHSCERKGLVEQHVGTNKTDVVCGKSWRVGPSGRLRRWRAEGRLGYPEAQVGKEGGEAKARGGGSFSLLEGTPAADVIQQTASGVDVIPASRSLATVKTGKGSARRLQEAINPPAEGKADKAFGDVVFRAGDRVIPRVCHLKGQRTRYGRINRRITFCA